MKKYITLLLGFTVLFAGCVTMPDPIDDAYLVEKTPDQSERLDKTEQAIIAKKNEGDEAKKKLAIAEKNVKVSMERVSVIEKERSLLIQKEKLFILSKEEDKLSDVRSKLQENEQQKKRENAHLKHTIAFRDNAKSILEIRQAELAVSIAELNYEKAKIAKAFLLKRERKSGKKADEEKGFVKDMLKKFGKSDKKTIDDKKYEKYLNKQRDSLEKANLKQKKTAEKLKQAEKELNDSGYRREG